jgi:hypothetical protein
MKEDKAITKIHGTSYHQGCCLTRVLSDITRPTSASTEGSVLFDSEYRPVLVNLRESYYLS